MFNFNKKNMKIERFNIIKNNYMQFKIDLYIGIIISARIQIFTFTKNSCKLLLKLKITTLLIQKLKYLFLMKVYKIIFNIF